MITVNIRKQGGAAVITIPADILRVIDAQIGTPLQIDVHDGAFTARPVLASRGVGKRYALKDLLRGTTPARIAKLNAETDWARSPAAPVGREIG
ncbi:MAG: AbrB family transcriptional regulator [Rhizobacter sp.]|nr:AbrB family transcriptional regulator [Burkholderiales bacterium]